MIEGASQPNENIIKARCIVMSLLLLTHFSRELVTQCCIVFVSQWKVGWNYVKSDPLRFFWGH